MIALLAAALQALQPAAAAIPARVPTPKPAMVAPGSWLVPGSFLPGRQPDGNSLVLEGRNSLLVFDTARHAPHADAILALIDRRHKPLIAIVNSHWHLDHVSGNLALRKAHGEAKVYASGAIDGALAGFLKDSAARGQRAIEAGEVNGGMAEDVAGDIATIARGAELRPNIVLAGPMTRIDLGGRVVELHLAHHAATAGDVWLYDRRTRLLASGDLVTLPAPFLDTACPEGWARALDAIAKVRFRTLIPGHGPAMNVTGFTTYRKAFRALVDCGRNGLLARCGAVWTAAAGSLVAGDRGRARQMASDYATRIRAGALDRFCPPASPRG